MRVRNGNVADFTRRNRFALRRVLRVDLIRLRSHLDLLVQFVGVPQGQGNFVGAGAQRERFPRQHKETLFTRFHFVVAGRKIAQREASRAIGLRAKVSPFAALQRDLRGRQRRPIFIEDHANAIGGIRGPGCSGKHSAQKNRPHRKKNRPTHVLIVAYSRFPVQVSRARGALLCIASAVQGQEAFWRRVVCRRSSLRRSGLLASGLDASEIHAGGSLAGNDSSDASSTASTSSVESGERSTSRCVFWRRGDFRLSSSSLVIAAILAPQRLASY